MVGWHHRLHGHESEQLLEISEGPGSLVSYSPWGRKELDTTERPNNSSNDLVYAKALSECQNFSDTPHRPSLDFVACFLAAVP